MIRNYIRTAYRNLLKHKGYTLINILGLATGLTCCLLILLYVHDELRYDRFHEKADRVHRVILSARLNDRDLELPMSPAPMSATLRSEMPDIESATRLRRVGNFTVRRDDRVFNEADFFHADSSFFDVFTVAWIRGDQAAALRRPHTVVLTDEMARKYFGDEDPIGRTLKVDGRTMYEVTGICQPLPPQSHFHFDFLASMVSLEDSREDVWLSNNFWTYAVLKAGSNQKDVESKLRSIVERYADPQMRRIVGLSLSQFESAGGRYAYFLQPLTDIHLHSGYSDEPEPSGNRQYVYILSVIAVFILALACINFMNLTTARSAGRAKEVGVRKVLGSARGQLISLFLAESILMSVVAMILAVGVVEFLLPFFNEFTGKQLTVPYLEHWWVIPGLAAAVTFVGLAAGVYPAFYLSAFRPVAVLKGELRSGIQGGWLRRTLVVFQFAVSIILIIGTAIVFRQLEFVRSKQLGFNKEQVLVVENAWLLRSDQQQTMKNRILQQPGVLNATVSNVIPGRDIGNSGYLLEGRESENPILLWTIRGDFTFIKALELTVKSGRPFDALRVADSQTVMINEAAARLLGIQELNGQRLLSFEDGEKRRAWDIIGIVGDFHFESLHSEIRPLVIHIGRSGSYLAVRLEAERIPPTLQSIAKIWSEFTGGEPFIHSFLDEDFDRLYTAEQRIGTLTALFALLGIFIACLGLFGLAAFTAAQRTKEIGVRKVMGASVPGIVGLLSKEFLVLVLAASLIAWPAAYAGMARWLEHFAYRIEIGWSVFLLSGLLAMLIAQLTVSYQALKAAAANPVESLRYE